MSNALWWLGGIVVYGTLIGLFLSYAIGGRKGRQWGEGIALGAAGFLSTFFGFGIADGAGFLVTVLGVIVMLYLINLLYRLRQRSMQRALQKAPALRDFGLAHFDTLDQGNKGLIEQIDIFDALDAAETNEEDRKLLRSLQREMSIIGHAIDASLVYAGPRAMVVTRYGISREDLRTYPDRMAAQYAREFGS